MTASAASAPSKRPGVGYLAVVAGSVLISLVSYRYLVPGAPGAAPPILANHFTRLGVLTIHVGFAATALLLGPFQFLAGLRRRRPALHRLMGTIYVICCLGGGAAGLVLAFGALTGPISTGGFGLLALLWMFTTARAFLAAKARRFNVHERWMIRSFALTFAAVTLRLYLPFAFFSPWGYDATYRAISWLCWVPNLLVAEAIVSGLRRRQSGRPPLAHP
jgi:uncharacterized membrane protein